MAVIPVISRNAPPYEICVKSVCHRPGMLQISKCRVQ